MQVAAVGIWGITFVVAWFASTSELAWSRDFNWTEIRGPVLTYGSPSRYDPMHRLHPADGGAD